MKGPRVTRDERNEGARPGSQIKPCRRQRSALFAPPAACAPLTPWTFQRPAPQHRHGRGTRDALILYSNADDWAPLFDESILLDEKTVLHFPARKKDMVGPISPDPLGGSVRNVLRTHEGFRETVNGSEVAASHRKLVSE
ncbi:hypothetical protein NJO91_07890 [Streptomyces microflavus]|uniref:hypothetical protein n=1 Tax=Streptomyces microflavus TaxID=1919 RepID=UPI0029BB78E1|nr:hypothetical protein [Streptomyces microflavus]MDX2403044.1 hypothetical protein [Streptomyces microflavus]